MIGRAGRMVLLAGMAALAACDQKEAEFFRLVGEGGGAPGDETAPVFSSAQPPPSSTVVNVEQFSVTVTDPPEENGAPGSGVDPETVQASLVGGGALPVTLNLPTVVIDVSGVPDGPVQVVVSARDRAGNQSVTTLSHVLDRAPPTVEITGAPPADDTTSEATYEAVVEVEVGADPNFASGMVEARTPGTDGLCGTADDGALPSEILTNPTRPLPTPGTATVEFVLMNPVPVGGPSQTVEICWVATARDAAVGPGGEAGVNESTASARSTIVFQGAAPTTGAVEGVVSDDGAPVAGATVELLTPTGGVVETTTTDATGFYRFSEVDPGSYRVRATIGTRLCGDLGVSVEAGVTDRVDLACPPPGGTLAGQVTSQGEGLPGATVTVRREGIVVATDVTGETGSYSIGGLAPGPYTAAVTAPAGHTCPDEPVDTGVAANQTTVLNFSCEPVATGTPSGDEVAGDWTYQRTLTDATGTCPAPLPSEGSGPIAHDVGTSRLFVLGLHPPIEMTCDYDPATGECSGGGQVSDGAGNTTRVTFDAVFSRADGGIVFTDQMVVEHVDSMDVTFCTETYSVEGVQD